MSERRFPWEAVLAFIFGAALGLAYAWVLAPVQVIDSAPEALRAEFKDQYRAAIAASYAANGNLTRAQSRLALLNDADAYQSLSAQAQQLLAAGQTRESQQVAQLASALQGLAPTVAPSTPTVPIAATSTQAQDPNAAATSTPIETETPLPFYTATARPTHTLIPTPGKPFELGTQENVCDESIGEGLLQITVQLTSRRQLPGIELILSWSGGEEHFFTGLKPELGNGYADFNMTSGVFYTLRAAEGGAVVPALTAPVCPAANGGTFFGGIRIVLQRP
ncbi:MAG: hypothetical protein HFACDABA_01204 [Anaerolineales bacterium]|nr:hypothetical protein [Anaerolineales bacterium]